MATGMTSWKLAKGLYLVPVLFAYSPLITGTWPERISVFFWSCFGLYAFAGLLQWRLEKALNPLLAAMLLASGVLLMWAPLSTLYHVVGLLLLMGVILWQKRFQAA
jgi:TRAP-type uncharacterized transport system fused permease subunit